MLGAISRAKNEMLDPTFLAENAANHRERTIARLATRYQERLRKRERARLRRPPARGRPAVRGGARRPRQVPGALALPPRRRIPGHEPRPIPVGPRARASHRNLCGRRRRRPVDLRVARRGPAQHPRLRARLAERRRRQARAGTTARPSSSSTPPTRSSRATPRARTRSSGPRTRAACRSSASRPTTRRRRPSGSPARSRAWSAAAARRSRVARTSDEAHRSVPATSRSCTG